MLFAETLTGIILIISGILVKKYPNLIAGYNTLSDADKQKVNIKSLSKFMHDGLIIIGAMSIILSIIMYFFKVTESYQLMLTTSFIILGVLYIILKGSKMKT
jgi:hypothetical protein